MLVCSAGGHFRAIQELRPFWSSHERVWVTFQTASSEATLTSETAYWAWSPTNRHLPNLIRNYSLAWNLLLKEQPDLVISTGAGIAVPFLVLAKLLGKQTIFIESITRVEQLSLSARLALPFLDEIYVHWPQLQARYPQTQLVSL